MQRFLKWLLIILGTPLLIIIIILFSIWLKYYCIVSVERGQLQVPVKPGALGQWVDPFIGTGGIPWVCAHNFPGAALPFGMVRLSPETATMIINKRALNTSGYYYPDNKIIGFSHTRLAGTGATDGGHFLIFPTTDFIPDNADWPEHRALDTAILTNPALWPARKRADLKPILGRYASERI